MTTKRQATSVCHKLAWLSVSVLLFLLVVYPPDAGAEFNAWQRPANPGAAGNPNAGGSLVVAGGGGYLPRVRYHLDVHIEDGFARTTIDQVYYNRADWRLEGTYRFPLPAGASISRLAMTVNGELMEGGMVEQQRAAAIYDEIRRQKRDPVLLEWIDGRTFKMRVFPIEPREYKRIIISYTERLDEIDGQWFYRFPGADLQETQEWSAKFRVVGAAWQEWVCDTHELRSTERAGDLFLECAAERVAPENELILRVDRHLSEPVMRFDTVESGGYRYAMVRWRPEIAVAPSPAAEAERVWSILFEASADRDPVFARQQIEALRALASAYPQDDFRVVTANTELAFEQHGIDFAKLDNVHLIGALDLGSAFSQLRKMSAGNGQHLIVHLGGGRPSLGERQLDKLLELLPKDVPYIGAGIGREVNVRLMEAAAEQSGGAFAVIEDGRDLLRLARRTIGRAAAVTVAVPGAPQTRFLVDADGAFAGGEFFAVARFGKGEELPGKLALQAQMGGGLWRRELQPRWREVSAGYLPRTWARMEIGRLAQAGESKRAEIVALSQEAFVMSPFTSLLVLESAKMHAHYKVGRGRQDHWAKYSSPDPKILDKPEQRQQRQRPNSNLPPRAPGSEKTAPGMEKFEPKFPKPMFIGTPVRVRVPNLEGRPMGGSTARPLVWRPMFAGELVKIADGWQDEARGWMKPRLSFHAPPGTGLLSLGSEVSSSDDLPIIGDLEMITDGDKDGADGSYVELGPGLQWVQIDLGARRELWAVILWHFHKNMRAYMDVVVQISDDPKFRNGVRTIYNNDHDNSSHLGVGSDKAWIETNHGRIIDVPGVAARYLRLYSSGNSSNEMNHYVEVEVWGSKQLRWEGEEVAGKASGWEQVLELETATEKEWQRQVEAGAIDLRWLRWSHAALLAEMAGALGHQPAPDKLHLRIMRIADRWWGIDAGSPEACQMAAALFATLGRQDLRWRYLTTPAAIAGGSANAWGSVEAFARRHGDPVLAELARREVTAGRALTQ